MVTVPSDAAAFRAPQLSTGPNNRKSHLPLWLRAGRSNGLQGDDCPLPLCTPGALYPHANSAVNGDTGKFVFAGIQNVPENFGTVRLDHRISDKDGLFGTYLIDDADYIQPDTMDLVLTNSHTRRQTVSIEETHTFGSSFVNAARIGYNRDYVINQFTSKAVSRPDGTHPGDDLSLGSTLNQAAPRYCPVHGITGTSLAA